MNSTAMAHLEYLAVKIGARGSTEEGEQHASQYAYHHLDSLNLNPELERFRSPKSGWRQFFFASCIGTAAILIGLFGGWYGAWIAGVLGFVTTASVILELYFRPNLLRLLVPKGLSQNIHARIPPQKEPIRRILVMAHIDTHRTPWVFTTPNRLKFFRMMSTLGTVFFALVTLLFLSIGIIGNPELRWLALPLLPIFLVVILMTGQADRTPFTRGANDNGSGAAIVLSLADQLAVNRLETTEVWLVLTGCEEVGSYGAQAFYLAHKDELTGLLAINIDNVGGKGAGVCYASVEGMLIPFRPSPELFRQAEVLRHENTASDVYPLPYTILHTDGTCLMSHGIPSMTFIGLTPDGSLPNWHQVSDTIENVDPNTIRAYDRFMMEMLVHLDRTREPNQL